LRSWSLSSRSRLRGHNYLGYRIKYSSYFPAHGYRGSIAVIMNINCHLSCGVVDFYDFLNISNSYLPILIMRLCPYQFYSHMVLIISFLYACRSYRISFLYADILPQVGIDLIVFERIRKNLYAARRRFCFSWCEYVFTNVRPAMFLIKPLWNK